MSAAAAAKLLAKAAAPSDWGVTAEEFREALERSAAQRFGGVASLPSSAGAIARLADSGAVEKYLDGLHLLDLALACACAAGREAAWDYFVTQHRPELYRAARAIAGDANARELADSLYGELYGLRETSEGKRRTLFQYFHGRSKLTTWLRAILAQRHVDEFRRTRNMESLDDPERDEAAQPMAAARPPDPERQTYLAMLQAALTAALGALEPRERLRMAYYYADDLTLAQIGRLMGEHEATVSRKLDRTRREVRQAVEAALREEKKLSDAQLKLCYEYARDEWPFDLTGALSARE